MARVAAAVWLVAVVVEGVLSLSQEAGAPVGDVLHWSQLRFYATNVTEGETGLAVIDHRADHSADPCSDLGQLRRGAARCCRVAGLVLPPLLTGHSASAATTTPQ